MAAVPNPTGLRRRRSTPSPPLPSPPAATHLGGSHGGRAVLLLPSLLHRRRPEPGHQRQQQHLAAHTETRAARAAGARDEFPRDSDAARVQSPRYAPCGNGVLRASHGYSRPRRLASQADREGRLPGQTAARETWSPFRRTIRDISYGNKQEYGHESSE